MKAILSHKKVSLKRGKSKTKHYPKKETSLYPTLYTDAHLKSYCPVLL